MWPLSKKKLANKRFRKDLLWIRGVKGVADTFGAPFLFIYFYQASILLHPKAPFHLLLSLICLEDLVEHSNEEFHLHGFKNAC